MQGCGRITSLERDLSEMSDGFSRQKPGLGCDRALLYRPDALKNLIYSRSRTDLRPSWRRVRAGVRAARTSATIRQPTESNMGGDRCTKVVSAGVREDELVNLLEDTVPA